MEAGSLFASYKIVKKLGHRSSGDLYLGMEVAGSSYVTLLVLDEHDPLYSAREPNFKGERSAAGTFSHPSICKLYDSGKHHSNHYLAIEYIRGSTLEELLDQRVPLSESERQLLAEKITKVVMAAHGAGITHGGLVPSAVYYLQKGKVKVTGFGCQTAPFNPPYGFLAPERRLGNPPSPASDLYSLAGIVTSLVLQGFIPDCETASPAVMASGGTRPLSERMLNSATFAEVNGDLRQALALLFAEEPAQRMQGAPLLIQCLSQEHMFKPVPFKFAIAVEAEEVPQEKAATESVQSDVIINPAIEGGASDEEVEVLEEADSCYWRAQNAAFDKKFAEAIKEYRKIMSLPLAIVSPLADKVENEASMLFWQTGLKSGTPGAYPGPSPKNVLDVMDYITFLQAFLPLSASLTREGLRTVTERRLLETILVAVTDKQKRSHLFREALMRCRNSTWTKREYCSFLEFDGRKHEALTQRMKLAVSLADEGLITEALEEYRAAKKLSADARAPERLLEVTDKAEKLKVVAEGVIEVLETSGEAALHVAEHFLSRMPSNVDIIQKVANFKSEQGLTEEAARLHSKATAISYNRSDRKTALENAKYVLEHTPNNIDALTYALDLLQREGQRPESKNLNTTAEKVLATLAVD